eukprot:scaffold1213_cov350-Prasinococcus_capsulatus_cf.AAC.11
MGPSANPLARPSPTAGAPLRPLAHRGPARRSRRPPNLPSRRQPWRRRRAPVARLSCSRQRRFVMPHWSSSMHR